MEGFFLWGWNKTGDMDALPAIKKFEKAFTRFALFGLLFVGQTLHTAAEFVNGVQPARGLRTHRKQGMFSARTSGGYPRGSSSSSSQNRSSSSDDEMCFECVVCIEDVRTIEGKIWQCPSGHIFCNKCYSALGGASTPCPSCKVPMASIRNRLAEKHRDLHMKQQNKAAAKEGVSSCVAAEGKKPSKKKAKGAEHNGRTSTMSAHAPAYTDFGGFPSSFPRDFGGFPFSFSPSNTGRTSTMSAHAPAYTGFGGFPFSFPRDFGGFPSSFHDANDLYSFPPRMPAVPLPAVRVDPFVRPEMFSEVDEEWENEVLMSSRSSRMNSITWLREVPPYVPGEIRRLEKKWKETFCNKEGQRAVVYPAYKSDIAHLARGLVDKTNRCVVKLSNILGHLRECRYCSSPDASFKDFSKSAMKMCSVPLSGPFELCQKKGGYIVSAAVPEGEDPVGVGSGGISGEGDSLGEGSSGGPSTNDPSTNDMEMIEWEGGEERIVEVSGETSEGVDLDSDDRETGGGAHPPKASPKALQYLREYKRLMKHVSCTEDTQVPHLMLSNFVVACKFVQLFERFVEENSLEKGTEGCVDACTADGVYILHVVRRRPGATRVEDIEREGVIVHGTSSVGVSWYVKKGTVVEISKGSPPVPVKVVGGVGFVSWHHVVHYSRSYVECMETPVFAKVLEGTFEGPLWVYVSAERPKFLGFTSRKLILDTSQVSFLLGREVGGPGGGAEQRVGGTGGGSCG